jgi:ABC-type Na+ efflux pump permease subunit
MAISMLASFRALRKDLFELQKTGRGLMLAFVTPPIIAILVGQLSVAPPNVRVLIAGAPAHDNSDSMDQLQALLEELPGVRVKVQSERPNDPLKAAELGRYDIVIVPNELGTGHVAAYSADTEPARVGQLTGLAGSIERAIDTIHNSNPTKAPESTPAEVDQPTTPEAPESAPAETTTPNQPAPAEPEQLNGVDALRALGIISSQSLYLYYPGARDRSAAFLPMTIALLLCFVPFIIAASSLIREKESHTIEILLTAPGMTHNWLFAAKCYLPILVAAFDAILMFICAEWFYQYYIKSGFLLLGIYVLFAISAATFLGLAVSAVVRSTVQAAAVSTVYFLCLLLFSGFFVNLDQSTGAVRIIANCLPLAALDQIVKTWMFGGQLPGASALPFRLLFGQTVLYGAIAWVSYRRVFMDRI